MGRLQLGQVGELEPFGRARHPVIPEVSDRFRIPFILLGLRWDTGKIPRIWP